MLRRTLLSALVIVVAWFAGRAAYMAMASDDTKIRWLFQDAAAAFHDGNALAALGSFAPDYQDETLQASRQLLHGGLLWLFQHRRDPTTGLLLLRIAYPPDFQVAIDGEAATATLPLVLHEGRGDDERAVWEVTVTAELRRGDDGWLVARSRHETVSGSPPGR